MYYFVVNNQKYTHSPYLPVITGWDGMEPVLGPLLKDTLGLTDEQAAAAHIEGLKNQLRVERDRLLNECDWVTARAVEQGQPVPAEWAAYRQALRDITDLVDGQTEVVFPQKPE